MKRELTNYLSGRDVEAASELTDLQEVVEEEISRILYRGELSFAGDFLQFDGSLCAVIPPKIEPLILDFKFISVLFHLDLKSPKSRVVPTKTVVSTARSCHCSERLVPLQV